MASKTEGIALLSMYNDEEEEEEEGEEQQQQQQQQSQEEEERQQQLRTSDEEGGPSPYSTPPLPPSRTPPYADADWNSKPATSPMDIRPSPSPLRPPPPPPASVPSSSRPSTPVVTLFPAMEAPGARGRKTGVAVAIVDYAHDENAQSPEAEEGEMVADLDMLDAELLDTDGSYEDKSSPGPMPALSPYIQVTPQSYEQPEATKSEASLAATAAENESEASDACQNIDTSVEMQEDIDPLKSFLPSPPATRCPQELQEKIRKFLALKEVGKSFNKELRSMKAYRNPDFLQHAVRYQEINQMGTCFSKDVFDPEGYDKSDYYDEIEADMKRELERKEQERKRSPKVEFVAGATQPGMTVSAPNTHTQISVPNVPVTMTSQTSVSAIDVKDGRQNKKSKWDKVDFDPKHPLQSGGTSISTASTHSTTLLSAASIGTGYSAFAQQKRREAEEKQSSERKYDRRS